MGADLSTFGMLTPTFGILTPAVGWLLTYVIHSTVLIGGAWLAVRLGIVGGPEGREALWKTALVAGVLTGTVQMVVEARGPSYTEARAIWAYRSVEQRGLSSRPVDVVGAFDVVVRRRLAGVSDDELAALLAGPSGIEGRAFDWRLTLLAVWGLGAVLMVFRLARTRIGLRAALAGKVDIDSGEAREILDELIVSSGLRGRVRLTASPALESPAGVGPREICLPLRAECGLTRSELRVVLAHELGHMTRRDPLWTIGSRLLADFFFIQPLNRLAIREMEAEAEFLCDDWAVRQTGEPIALARSLTRISEWLTSPPPAHVLSVVRDPGTPLGRRVRRILTPAAERPRAGRARVLALVVLLLGATAFVPTVQLAGPGGIRLVALEGTDVTAARLGAREWVLPSGKQAVFVGALRSEVTAP